MDNPTALARLRSFLDTVSMAQVKRVTGKDEQTGQIAEALFKVVPILFREVEAFEHILQLLESAWSGGEKVPTTYTLPAPRLEKIGPRTQDDAIDDPKCPRATSRSRPATTRPLCHSGPGTIPMSKCARKLGARILRSSRMFTGPVRPVGPSSSVRLASLRRCVMFARRCGQKIDRVSTIGGVTWLTACARQNSLCGQSRKARAGFGSKACRVRWGPATRRKVCG